MNRLRHKIGQMLIMGFAGSMIDDASPVAQWLQQDGLGGVLLFDFDIAENRYGKNLVNSMQIKTLNHQLNHYACLADTSVATLPLFIAVDYEGGSVDRFMTIDGCMTTMNACRQAQLSDDNLFAEAQKMAYTIQELGFNLNFAPVVDLNLNEHQGIIGQLGRSFSAEPASVIRAARQFVRAFNQQGIVCAYKHFPGHGSACGDTHHGFVDVTDTYQSSELGPYVALLNEADLSAMIMTAHVINRQLDASGMPATLSSPILTGLLRDELGYNGVIVSDDLQMKAISSHYDIDEALRLTINAGADMLIFANQLGYISATDVIDRIERLVHSGAVSLTRIEQAYQRISCLKQEQLSLN